MNREFDTISAICTGLTESGISVIRISGPDSVKTADMIFRSPSGKVPSLFTSNVMHFGHIYDGGGDLIDEAMCVVMRSPHSYTAEDCVEIQCHGGIRVTSLIQEIILSCGIRQADPGEFTKRAFLNGRIDLSQAEAVMSLISAGSERAVTLSSGILEGRLGNKIRDLRDSLKYAIAHIEAALDDPDEIEYSREDMIRDVGPVMDELQVLISSFKTGRLIESGADTVITGLPNSGKSSLMNFFSGEETSIVTDIPGTTRDAVRTRVTLDRDIVLNLTDTAGLRDTDDTIEKIGVDRTLSLMEKADLIIFLVDGSVSYDPENDRILEMIRDKRSVILLTKSDLPAAHGSGFENINKYKSGEEPGIPVISFSSVTGDGFDDLKEAIREKMGMGSGAGTGEFDLMLTSSRQESLAGKALSDIRSAIDDCDKGVTEDLYVSHLYEAYDRLSEILGEEVGEDIIDEIFSSFCLGK
ncbi:MAG: tRNA uridine-5-carboxymethylaminomethyl(34) synthesis GTPase MnmE [Lachnospiraceae bacterium]|nr:tRNA uridine-5-carboxymethylaminomethyl(34) synthesis GTPase MnmE [Lachnospiraceae bacterium]